MKTLPGIPKVIEEMPFPENDQQIATHETAPPDITLEIVSPKLYTAKLICILKIVLRAMSISNGTIQDVLYYVLRRKKPTGVAEIA
jgi:Uma2 family endonuclease